MKIYLAGAMACYGNSNKAKEWREEVKKYFRKYGEFCKIISPVDYYSIGSNNSKKPSEIMRFDVRRHIVGGTNRTLFSVNQPFRLCRTGTCRRFSAG